MTGIRLWTGSTTRFGSQVMMQQVMNSLPLSSFDVSHIPAKPKTLLSGNRADAASTPGGGRESGFSAYAPGSTTPPPVSSPQNVAASDGLPSHVVVDWSPVPNANYYQVDRSESF